MNQSQANLLRVFLTEGASAARPIFTGLLASDAGFEHCAALLAFDDARENRITYADAFSHIQRTLEPPPRDLSILVVLLCNLLYLALRLNRADVARDADEQLKQCDAEPLAPEIKASLVVARYHFLRSERKAHHGLPLLSEAARLPLNVGSRPWCLIRQIRAHAAMQNLCFALAESDLNELEPYKRNLDSQEVLPILWAGICIRTSRVIEGIAHLDQIESPVQRVRAIPLRTLLLLQAGRITEAESAIEEAQQAEPSRISNLDAMCLRIQSALIQGHVPQARAHAASIMGQAFGSTRMAAKHLQVLLDVDLATRQAPAARRKLQFLDPYQDLPNMAMDWARLHLLEGNEEEAVRYFARVLESDSPFYVSSSLRMACEVSSYQIERLRCLAQLRASAPQSRVSFSAPAARAGTASPASIFVGESAAAREVRAAVERFAPLDASVLITGETGTGKEVVARQLHALSARASAPFVPVNCGGISDTLIESEMFGCVRGAFTGAMQDREGLFVAAGRGVIFLDEIDSMSPQLQNSLLRVLENGEVRPVGSAATRRVNVRVIAASNQPLEESVLSGRFRSDLYYRLAQLHIDIPPLRDRRGDIELLVRHFLDGQHGRRKMKLAEPLIDALRRHQWPGNVRELRNELGRMMALAGNAPELGSELFRKPRLPGLDCPAPDDKDSGLPPANADTPSGKDNQWDTQSRRRRIRNLFERHGHLTRAELHRMIGCSGGTITHDLKALAREGFIRRVETSNNLRTSYFVNMQPVRS